MTDVGDQGPWVLGWSLVIAVTECKELFEEAKWIWPTGGLTGSEVLEAQASGVSTGNHKELRWSAMNEETRNAFREAAVDQDRNGLRMKPSVFFQYSRAVLCIKSWSETVS